MGKKASTRPAEGGQVAARTGKKPKSVGWSCKVHGCGLESGFPLIFKFFKFIFSFYFI